MIYEIPVVERPVGARSVVELVETQRRQLRAVGVTPPRDAHPSRARRERMPAQLRVWGAASRIRPVVE
ncbi:MAG: hypothetical protein AB7K08_10380 [Microbacteriaceae bacterium]